MMQAYHGRGKGKTSAAVGAAVRAAGHGWRVLVVQFMKDSGADSGEVRSLERLPGLELMRAPLPHDVFHPPGRAALEEMKAATRELLARAAGRLGEVSFRMIVLDELGIALWRGWLGEAEVRRFLDSLPGRAEVIVTGRRMPRWLLDRAGLVTRFVNVRHPFDRGVKARRGVEW